jgi:hypothetical protein
MHPWNVAAFAFLVNNAGVGKSELFARRPKPFSIFFAPSTSRDQSPRRKRCYLFRDGGRILNMSSGLTRFTATGYSIYAGPTYLRQRPRRNRDGLWWRQSARPRANQPPRCKSTAPGRVGKQTTSAPPAHPYVAVLL